MSGPLEGIRVVDLTSVLMGPYSTLWLGDLGADVIKVESKQGDSTRFIGPRKTEDMGNMFLHIGRNKRSIVLDLKTKAGRNAMLEIIKDADIFVHSLRHQAIEKLGLTYENLQKVNKNIIYCAAYGFGQEGPYAKRPAYDDIIQAASGLAAVQGKSGDGAPKYMANVMADKTTGLVMLSAILSALYYRERHGEGQSIEVPMFETMSAFNLMEHLYGITYDPPLDSSYYPRVTSKYRKPYKTKDGFISIIVYNDKQWTSFFKMINRPDLAEDDRYNNIQSRTKHIDKLYRMLEETMATRTTGDWLEILEEVDIPAMPVMEPEDLLEDEHLNAVKLLEKIEHPIEGTVWNVHSPINFSKTPASINRFAPYLGEHSVEVLEEAGYSAEEIDKLLEENVTVKNKKNS